MLAIFEKSKLAAGVLPALPTVSVGNTISAIEGIMMKFNENNTVTITSYDMEKGMRTVIEADVREPGCAIINAQKLSGYIRTLPDGEITIKIDQSYKTVISGGLSSFELKAIPGDVFPALPELDGDRGFAVSQKTFIEYLNSIAFASAPNDPRPAFRGCFIRLREQIGDADDESGRVPVLFTMVTCDGFRLAKCEGVFDMTNLRERSGKLNYSILVPAKTVLDFIRVAKDSDEEMKIFVSLKHAIFVIGDYTYFCRLIDAEFIDYERMMPTSQDKEIHIFSRELQRSLERAALVTEDKLAGSVRACVKWHVENDVLYITGTTANSSVYDELKIHQEGEPITIGFNCRYLLDALKTIPDIPIQIKLSNPAYGVSFEPEEGEEGDWYYFIMPVRMAN